MVFHPIARLKQAGIKDILVVTGRDHMGARHGTAGQRA